MEQKTVTLKAKNTTLSNVPLDVLRIIFSLLDIPNLVMARRVCRAFLVLVDEQMHKLKMKVTIGGLSLDNLVQDLMYYENRLKFFEEPLPVKLINNYMRTFTSIYNPNPTRQGKSGRYSLSIGSTFEPLQEIDFRNYQLMLAEKNKSLPNWGLMAFLERYHSFLVEAEDKINDTTKITNKLQNDIFITREYHFKGYPSSQGNYKPQVLFLYPLLNETSIINYRGLETFAIYTARRGDVGARKFIEFIDYHYFRALGQIEKAISNVENLDCFLNNSAKVSPLMTLKKPRQGFKYDSIPFDQFEELKLFFETCAEFPEKKTISQHFQLRWCSIRDLLLHCSGKEPPSESAESEGLFVAKNTGHLK